MSSSHLCTCIRHVEIRTRALRQTRRTAGAVKTYPLSDPPSPSVYGARAECTGTAKFPGGAPTGNACVTATASYKLRMPDCAPLNLQTLGTTYYNRRIVYNGVFNRETASVLPENFFGIPEEQSTPRRRILLRRNRLIMPRQAFRSGRGPSGARNIPRGGREGFFLQNCFTSIRLIVSTYLTIPLRDTDNIFFYRLSCFDKTFGIYLKFTSSIQIQSSIHSVVFYLDNIYLCKN